MAFLKLPMYGGLKIEDWFRQVWQMLNRRVGGTYTPTLSNVSNITASTIYECTWFRIDDVVCVSGRVDITPTAVTGVILGISLPITSNFTSVYHCNGSGSAINISGQHCAVEADTTNKQALLKYMTLSTANRPMVFNFTYKVV